MYVDRLNKCSDLRSSGARPDFIAFFGPNYVRL
jgi:hypothetical protein